MKKLLVCIVLFVSIISPITNTVDNSPITTREGKCPGCVEEG